MKKLWLDDKRYVELSEDTGKQEVRVQSTLAEEISTRDSAGEIWSKFFDVIENPDPVLRRTGYAIDVYDEIKRDSQVTSCITGRRSGILKLQWRLDQNDASQKAVDVINGVFKNLKWHKIYREILDALFYGYSVQEVVWDTIGGYILPKKIEQKPARWFSFNYNNELMRLNGGFNMWTQAEPMKFLLSTNDATYENPFGLALLSLAFWPVTFKKPGLKFWARFLEKFGMPHAVGKLPINAEHSDRQKLLNSLHSMIQNACAVIPDNSSIELIEASAKSASSDLYERHSKYHDAEISKVILGHGSAADSTPGRLGGEDASLTVREDLIDSDKVLVCEAVNELIGWIFELNPSLGTDRPAFVLYEKEGIDQTLAERDSIVSKSGKVAFTKSYYKKAYGYGDDDIIVDESTGTNQQTQSGQAQFSEPVPDHVTTAESVLNTLSTAIPDVDFQKEMEKTLKPVFDLRDKCSSFSEFRDGLVEIFPEMDTSGIEKILEGSGLLADVWGRLNAGNE